MPDLLLELFSEEIPARMQKDAAAQLKKRLTDALVDAGLTYEGAREYWTPRRLTLDIRGLTTRSADIREERKGPRTDAPRQAIEGFLRGVGLDSVDGAEIRSDPKKGDFYVAVIEKPGREARAIIAEVMPAVIRDFNWPRSMRWGEASREPGSLRWVRPLQSVLCVFGPETGETEVIDFAVDGIRPGDSTRGHRFMAPAEISVRRFDDYVASLAAARVMLDPGRRADTILSEARNLAFAQGFELVEDAGLLAETANLVEWPVVLMGEFDADFLVIPDEVTRLTIRDNQKCFVLRGRDGALTSRFVMVANIEASDGGAEIARGNAKVVNARLADARFFWESDLRQVESHGFEPWIEGLDTVTFHALLGSQGERVRRIARLAARLAPTVGADPQGVERAARLAKADLQSQMVFEFPEVQGHMGRLYAERAGEAADVARAIEEHYRPLGPSDAVPAEPVSVAVALADKLDTLAGFWAIDQKPTGSKDPYALRRAALGVIRLVLENDVRLRTGPIIDSLLTGLTSGWCEDQENIFEHILYLNGIEISRRTVSGRMTIEEESDFINQHRRGVRNNLVAFLHDRLKVWLRDRGARHDLIDAVVAPDSDDILLIARKVEALGRLVESEDGVNLLAGYKRAANILAAEEKKDTRIAATVSPQRFETEEERALFETLEDVEALAGEAIAREEFDIAMARMSTLRAPIDNFFEHVLVNAEDEDMRANRLALLERIRAVTATVADFSRIAG